MRNVRRSAVSLTALCLLAVASVANAAPEPFASSANASNADAVTLIYDPSSGNVAIDTGGTQATSLEVRSQNGNFWRGTPEARPEVLTGLFDVWNPDKLFKLEPAGFGNVDLGAAANPGLSADAVLADLLVDGSLVGGGNLRAAGGGGPFLHVVPEPSSLVLLGLGLVSLLGLRRR